ncbi:hypothetical protein CA600_12475 [Paenibacillus sp. VTT E-133280]|uniref:hypothetical protein n=1 Tax=Paenibacillus sp. VTT E-133280 TaxID=1986222 RepID=UPI000BA0DED0|nr:hypothetical protein [Paenibacillus sp. VTT E-133280]OZQ66068.1 hypothetical protein CA600_12475 [Paenibacillus sp. VTT E-133280]
MTKKKEDPSSDEQSESVKVSDDTALNENKSDPDAAGTSKPSEVQTGISLKSIVLKGTLSQKTGPHTLFIGSRIVNFKDGEAKVQEDLAEELENGGYIE